VPPFKFLDACFVVAEHTHDAIFHRLHLPAKQRELSSMWRLTSSNRLFMEVFASSKRLFIEVLESSNRLSMVLKRPSIELRRSVIRELLYMIEPSAATKTRASVMSCASDGAISPSLAATASSCS
jgi:hypothetical protein